MKELINQLLDYRIIHAVGSALTHKTVKGTYNAYMIDVGAYANRRKLEERFTEIDVRAPDAKERLESCPTLPQTTLPMPNSESPAWPHSKAVPGANPSLFIRNGGHELPIQRWYSNESLESVSNASIWVFREVFSRGTRAA